MNDYVLRCVVLEDEDDIRRSLIKKLKRFPELEIIGEATNVNEAYRLIAMTKPDAAFMDIKLIGGDAFTLLSRLKSNDIKIPYIVMTTGFPEYIMTSLNDYRNYVVQYLLKPFLENWQEKLRKAIDALMAAKMKDDLAIQTVSVPTVVASPKEEEGALNKFTFIKNKGSFLKVEFDKVAYLEAAGSGESFIVTDGINHQVDLTLNKLIELLPPNFFRISRTNILNKDRVVKINRDDRTVEVQCFPKNKELGIGDVYYRKLLEELPMAKGRVR